MKTLKELLIELNACEEALDWADDKKIEQVVEQCHRGDWLLWLAQKVDIGLKPLTLAKGHCANTVRHLMKDKRSIDAVDAAIAFGEGRATIEELDLAAAAAGASYGAAYAAAAASYASTSYAAYAAAAAYAAKKENQMQTADICRKYIGQLIIDKVKGELFIMKQTAVEWFFDNLKSHQIQAEHLSIYQKAKEMEKQQIKHAYWSGCINSDEDKDAAEYYNEIYK